MMTGFIIQISILSFIFIFLVHHLLNYFTNSLTIPKVKDMIDFPNKKYDKMFSVIHSSNDTIKSSTTSINDILLPSQQSSSSLLLPQMSQSSHIPTSLPPPHQNLMKQELKNFLKSQMNSQGNFQPI